MAASGSEALPAAFSEAELAYPSKIPVR